MIMKLKDYVNMPYYAFAAGIVVGAIVLVVLSGAS